MSSRGSWRFWALCSVAGGTAGYAWILRVYLPDLAAAAQDLGFPLRPPILAIDVHLGPRPLAPQKTARPGRSPGRGILAGRGQAASQARALLFEPLQDTASSGPGLHLGDDE
eukprot:507307-Pyramimonas_sp.AAC.1